jgi:propanol-preferring alcohol dehydrogenase
MLRQLLERPAPIARRPLRRGEAPDPSPGAGEVVIGVDACAVCRTDLQLVEGDLEARVLPIVPGHQVVGVVESVGEGVRDWSVGDRAALAWLGGACGVCRFCSSGRENLCEQAVFTGWDRDGGYAEKVVARADFVLRMPATFTEIEAAPLLCGGVIGYRSLRVSGIEPGGRLGLYGFGASALLAIQVALHWGCEVFVATRSRREQQRALDMGAAWAGPYDERPPVPLEAAVTFAPVGYVVVEALKSVDRGGTVAVNAIHLDRIPEFGYDLLWWERSIRSVANFTRADAQEFLDLAAQIPVQTIVEVSPLSDAGLALQRLADGRVEGAAVLTTG